VAETLGNPQEETEIARDMANRIRYWRRQAGLRPVDLARKLEMSESSVSRWESIGSNHSTPSMATAHRIAAACGVSWKIFITGAVAESFDD